MGIICNHGRPDLPGWGLGQWGLIPWDSDKLPGNVDSNLVAYNLRLENLGAYPGAGWTAEIQTRDLKDRINHTFQRHARLDQILADGNLTTLAGIFLLRDVVYLSCIVSSCVPGYSSLTEYRRSPTKVVLYRLDSVSDGVGLFTQVGNKVLNTAMGPLFGSNNDYAPGPFSIYSGGAESRIGGLFNAILTYDYVDVYDYNGAHHLIQSWNIQADMLMCPYTPDLNALTVGMIQWEQSRVVTAGTYVNDPRMAADPGSYLTVITKAKRSFVYIGISGAGDTAHEANEVPMWDSSMQGNAILYRTGSYLQLSSSENAYAEMPVLAHPASFSVDCNFALFWGLRTNLIGWQINGGTSGTRWVTNYLVDQNTRTATDYTPIANTLGASESVVGLWGIGAGAVFVKKNTTVINHDQFYVVKPSDLSCAHKYSIFSALQDDGTVIHIEGLEDPTPTFWEDETFLSDLN
ncbi:hypothetical protein [Mesoterricola silvestris]|uniref:Uncharacterized protein n=1 Tax=Mesoterricola silvestris TaxID=2927979 RepID=A0AA48GRX7_9BACT|nr:hypothetical protein [Mesoterricola silvestris]BDU72902.1 hypothetical protein METEAL_20760 [Mesoterricola silvestris]